MVRERFSNFEALRLFGMVIIVSQHYAGYPDWGFERDSESYRWFNEYFVHCMRTTGKVGVDIFLLMTGYFLNGKGLKATSVARTWLQTLNWSYFCLIIASCFITIDRFHLRLSLFPITQHGYWFVSSYVMAGLCTGWIGSAARSATPSQYIMALVALFTLMSVFQWSLEILYSNSQWFIFVMSLGAFLRRFSAHLMAIRTKVLVGVLALASIVNFGSVYVFLFHDIKWANDRKGSNALTAENWTVLSLVYAVTLLLLVQRWKFSYELINKLAGLTLGVYLLHENQYVRHQLWNNWIRPQHNKDSIFLPVIAPMQVVFVYTVCSVIEYNRQLLVGGLEEKIANWIGSRFDSLADHVNTMFAEEKPAIV